MCEHPGLSDSEHEQLAVVVDQIKCGLFSPSYFGPPANAALQNNDGTQDAPPIPMEPKFYFDVAMRN